MSNRGDKVDAFNKDQSHRKSKKTVSAEEWGMGCQSDNNRRHIGQRRCAARTVVVNDRRTKDNTSSYYDCCSIDFFNENNRTLDFRNCHTRPSSSSRKLSIINNLVTFCRYRFISYLVFVYFLLFGNIVKGDTIPAGCHLSKCAHTFTRDSQMERATFSSNIVNCVLLTNYAECLNRTGRACRGNLRFHSLLTMVNSSLRDFNCTKLIDDHKAVNSASGGDSFIKSATSPDTTTGSGSNRCNFPYHHQKGASGYRYCSAFGDPHLRTFEGQYETCKTMGAWPLVDNAYVNVQLMNEALVDGVNASAITKISVIIKAVSGCTEQKTYTATKDSLPSAFDDGTVHNGHVDADRYHYESTSSSTATAPLRGAPPALFLQTLKYDQHIELHLRYVATRVVIRRSAASGHLSVAVKMPEDALSHESSFSTWQLCMAGCPAGEKINYKEILAYPDYYLKNKMAVSRDVAVEQCRAANVTDFFFDSCVFDVLTTGDPSFVETARSALEDIRHMYPPYTRHYETNRSDLRLYDELARLARDKENSSGDDADDQKHRHNNNRRYSAPSAGASNDSATRTLSRVILLITVYWLISIK